MTNNILFDASRLLSRTDRGAPTGIDRVCLAYAEWLIGHSRYEPVAVRGRAGSPALVERDWFEEQIKALRARWDGEDDRPLRDVDQALIDALGAPQRPLRSIMSLPPAEPPVKRQRKLRSIKQYFRARRVETLPPAMAYINVGHTGLDQPTMLQAVKDASIPRILMVHDLIPVTHPEFCRPGDDAKHHLRMKHALTLGSHIIANSQYTADELSAFGRKHGYGPLPIEVAHLGLEARLSPLGKEKGLRTSRPYFIHVGTIEARKNLAFILSVWRRLEEEMGDDVPSLVLAGRYGWENESVLDYLERCPNLQGVVHQISGAPDSVLSRLMHGARAVLAPSSVEGFDLPAVEASAMGLALIASDIPPHRELTPHARLVDPLDGPGWVEAIKADSRLARIPSTYNAPSWDNHFGIIDRQILFPLAVNLR